MFKQLNQAAYSTYDPSIGNRFDPSIGAKINRATGDDGSAPGQNVVAAKPGQKMQINITLSNPTASDLTFELFSYLDSQFRRIKTEYVVGNYKYIPLSSYQGMQAVIAATDGTVGFSSAGDAEIRGIPANPVAKISCKEIAYNAFWAASGIIPFQVAYIRFTCGTDNQIDEVITWFQKSFSGGIQENRISPRAYFRPNQFQNRTIDITISFSIGIDSGIRQLVLAGESVRYALFIQMWTNQALNG